jgi:formylglycine-generating enzyme required for sulfatase activity
VGNEQGGYTDPPLPNIPRITLPSEQQWQRAAIGDTGWVYPWGNDFDPRRCNSKESGMGKPTPVTQYPNGASPYGVFGMSGNVWEWCLTEWGGESKDIISKSRRVLRGGSWSYLDHDARAAARANRNPASRSSSYGFRVVCSAPILW